MHYGQKTIGLWVKKFRRVVSKLLSACPEERFEDFFWKHEIYFISYLERKSFGLLAAKKLWLGFQNINLRVQGNIFRNIFLKKRCFLTVFCTSSKKVTVFCQKIYGRIFKTAIYMSRGKICEKVFQKVLIE